MGLTSFSWLQDNGLFFQLRRFSCMHLSPFSPLSAPIAMHYNASEILFTLRNLHSGSGVPGLILFKWKLGHRTWGNKGIKKERRKDMRVKESMRELYKLGWGGWKKILLRAKMYQYSKTLNLNLLPTSSFKEHSWFHIHESEFLSKLPDSYFLT